MKSRKVHEKTTSELSAAAVRPVQCPHLSLLLCVFLYSDQLSVCCSVQTRGVEVVFLSTFSSHVGVNS